MMRAGSSMRSSALSQCVCPLALQFEKLTREFLAEIGARVPDKTRLFVWRQDGRAVAFALCLVDGEDLYYEYVGFDYAVALKLHLYYRVFHDIIEWAIANGYREFYSGSLNYDPKWHLRQSLAPIDLYVRHSRRRSTRCSGACCRCSSRPAPIRSCRILRIIGSCGVSRSSVISNR